MTLVVPYACLDNIFMVLLISAVGNFKIGATKPVFLDSGFLRGEGVHVCVSMVCYHCIVHILNASNKLYFEKLYFSLSLTAICAELCCQTT